MYDGTVLIHSIIIYRGIIYTPVGYENSRRDTILSEYYIKQ